MSTSYILTSPLLHYGFQVIAMFHAKQHEQAMLRVKELATSCPNADILACSVVEVSIIASI